MQGIISIILYLLRFCFLTEFVVNFGESSVKSCVYTQVYIVMKRHHDCDRSNKAKHLIVTDLQFRGFVHYHLGRKHGNVRVDMVLERS